ncbi:hypothetical protein, partial [Burkholderia pyrrocinia]|uniref:hypothetical protein n=1 Tax=Burkholderia pyrrocinia TaxID=60550 RepID=UPI001ABA88E4
VIATTRVFCSQALAAMLPSNSLQSPEPICQNIALRRFHSPAFRAPFALADQFPGRLPLMSFGTAEAITFQ